MSKNMLINVSKTRNIAVIRMQSIATQPSVPGTNRVTFMRILGVTIRETLSVSDHVNNILGSCASSTYALKTLRLRGMPDPAMQEVTRATMMERMIYASPAWWGYPMTEDRERLERSNRRAIRAGFLPPDAPTVSTLAERADDFGAIIRDRCHVLRHLCHERPTIRYELRTRPRPFILPIKDNRNFIYRLILKTICW